MSKWGLFVFNGANKLQLVNERCGGTKRVVAALGCKPPCRRVLSMNHEPP